jgi:hypothetical protein
MPGTRFGPVSYQRGDCRGVGTVDYGSDRAQERPDGTAVYPGRDSVPGEQRREAGAVTGSIFDGQSCGPQPLGYTERERPLFSVAGFMHTKSVTGASIEYFVGEGNRNVTLTKYDDAE